MGTYKRLARRDFVRLRQLQSRRVHGALFSLAIAPRALAEGVQFACVVSKKVSPKAVERNRIKRCCREAVRSFTVKERAPQTLVVTAKRSARGASPKDMMSDISTILKKI